MSKNHKKSKTTISSFALSVKPVPAGKVSLAEFVGSEAGQLAVRTAVELDHSEKAFAILCGYQTYEICNELEFVSADVILTHPVGVNLTHLGNDGGFLATDNVDSGASSGDQSNGASRRQH